MPESFANNASTTIAGSSTGTGAGSKQVASTTTFPAAGRFHLLCESEIIVGYVVDSTHIYFETRAAESTTAVDHATSTTITHILTARGLRNLVADPLRDEVRVFDDFLNIARGPWQFTNSGTGAAQSQGNPIQHHPGVVLLRSGTAASAYAVGTLGSTASIYTLLANNPWQMRCALLNASTPGQCDFRFGMANQGPVVFPPSSGAYLEKLAADTNWFAVVRNASTQTRTDTGVAATASTWQTLQIRYDGTTVYYSVNDAVEAVAAVTNAAYLTSTQFIPFMHNAYANTGFADYNVDYADVLVSGLTRT